MGVQVARARVARMVAAACLADGQIVRLDTARRALFELIEPVLGGSTGEGGWDEKDEEEEEEEAADVRCSMTPMVRMAGGVLLEHVVQEQLRCAGSKSVLQKFEEEMVRRGVWGALVSSMATSVGVRPKGSRDAAARVSLARALVMTSAYSEKLHAWAIRVPGYAAAWTPSGDVSSDDADDVDAMVLRAAWSALRVCAGEDTPRHVRFLREVFCGRGADGLTECVSTLEMTERLCRALEDRDGNRHNGNRHNGCTGYTGDLDTVDRIEGLRAVVRERILAAERARVVAEDTPRRLSTLPEVERLRHVDRMLKGLCGACGVGGTTTTNGKCD